jgi:hypothetical protein
MVREWLGRVDRWTLLIGAAVVAMLVRFVGLASSPPGFYIDEVVAGAQLACLTYTGVDAFGNSMPLVSVWPAPGVSAVFPPQYLYPGVAWVSIFGASVGSIRAIEVVISLTTVLSTAGVAYNFFGRRGFAWALFLGAFSPWAWTLGRIGFGISGNPSAASLMVGLWVITRGKFRRPPTLVEAIGWGAAWGTCAMYGYARASLLLVGAVVVVMLYRRQLLSFHRALVAAVSAFVMFSPVIFVILDGQFFGRVNNVSILNDQWQRVNGINSPIDLARVFLENVGRHLSPDFLFVNGDANLRHSTQLVGQLGWLETLLLLAVPIAFWLSYRNISKVQVPRVYLVLVGCGVVGGLVTASITYEGVPHANRLISAQPFVVLGLTLVALILSDRWRVLVPIALVIMAAFSVYFVPRYFGEYREQSAVAFESKIRLDAEAARASGSMDAFIRTYSAWEPKQLIYYWVGQDGGALCPGNQ